MASKGKKPALQRKEPDQHWPTRAQGWRHQRWVLLPDVMGRALQPCGPPSQNPQLQPDQEKSRRQTQTEGPSTKELTMTCKSAKVKKPRKD